VLRAGGRFLSARTGIVSGTQENLGALAGLIIHGAQVFGRVGAYAGAVIFDATALRGRVRRAADLGDRALRPHA